MSAKETILIKKYANRRLYHTGTSTYITLEDLALMVRKCEDFAVVDAKTGEDLTRSVLTQIIFEQENKGQYLLPVAFLRQLIQFYGDNMQALVPSYLEFSLGQFMADQRKLREQFAQNFVNNAFNPQTFNANPFVPMGQNPITAPMTAIQEAMQEQARSNMALFTEAMRAFSNFPAPTTKEKE